MTEEDEIDILGDDFTLDNLLSKSDASIYGSTSLVSQNINLLNCDYTIHPQWLLDKPSANPTSWYQNESGSSFPSDLTLGNPQNALDFESETKDNTQVCTENVINDQSGWTDKEKSLLKRGIEIFGKSSVCLSQFIGSKTAPEVKHYLKHYFSDLQLMYDLNDGLLTEESCLASSVAVTETVIDENEIPASIEEVVDSKSMAKPKSKMPRSIKTKNNKDRMVKFKFKANLDIVDKQKVNNYKMPVNPVKRPKFTEVGKINQVEIVTGIGLSVPVCDGEQVVKIIKENSEDNTDSDLEIDIEDTDDSGIINRHPVNTPRSNNVEAKQNTSRDAPKRTEDNMCEVNKNTTELEASKEKISINFSELSETLVRELTSLEEPQHEIIMEPNNITDLEKFIHGEFFEEKFTKTPSRYLKIRNHILNAWIQTKPNYVTKTSVRQGLKNCGDVNTIGRVHYFLEQIGAINFGCDQTSYARPLSDMVLMNTNMVKEKTIKTVHHPQRNVAENLMRPRNKIKLSDDGDGGYTLTHDDKGNVIHTVVISETPVVKKPHLKKPVIKLLYCRSFSDEYQQDYKIQMNLSTLLLMDLHAHSSLSEVMGLIGGIWNPHNKTLIISHYEPCKNVASSATHCDMCPVSQAKAADTIHSQGLDILGWYHSHPTFAPEPSQQDLDTQLCLQRSIGSNKPCIGVILSPFSLQGALIASPFRCMVVRRKIVDFEEQYVPYKLKTDVHSLDFCLDDFLEQARKIFEFISDGGGDLFRKEYFLDNDITYMDKFLSSVKMYLAKCGDLNKMSCDGITHGLIHILQTQKLD